MVVISNSKLEPARLRKDSIALITCLKSFSADVAASSPHGKNISLEVVAIFEKETLMA